MGYSDEKKVLFSTSGHTFTTKKRDELLESGNESLFITKDDYSKMKEYRAENIEELLKNPNLTSDDRAELLYESVSDQMYNMFERCIDQKSVHKAKKYVQLIVQEIITNRMHSEALLRLTSHDFTTHSHSVNVSMYAIALGKELGLSETEMMQVGTGALLHDLGKSKISSKIINKPGKLTIEEFQEMKKHPRLGYEILKEMGETDELILQIVKGHHEKLDGSGYGEGLTKDLIKIETQVVTIADIFDALTTNRSYKRATPYFTSFKTMKVLMKEQINMEYLDRLIKMMGRV
ncbi:MAG: HD domain-containing protein [Campylobacterota bacterium]|nr:HD domain-containing protein [Campylobacterota bacterium]